MPLPIATHPAIGREYPIVCIGDSVTETFTFGVRDDQHYPEVLAGLLRAQRCRVRAANLGHSGNTTGPYGGIATTITAVTSTTNITVGTGLGITTGDHLYINGQSTKVFSYTSGTGVIVTSSLIIGAIVGMPVWDFGPPGNDMMTRATGACSVLPNQPEATAHGVPPIAIILGGHNDLAHLWNNTTAPTHGANSTGTVASFTQNQQGITSVTLQTGQGTGFVAGQAAIVGTGTGIQATPVRSISGDTLTFAVPLPGPVAIGDAVGQGTQQNLRFMAQWLINQGATHVVIVSEWCQNHPNGTGDFAANGTLAPLAAYALLRGYQQAAAAATYAGGTVVYCDLFNAMASVALGTATHTSGGSTGTNPFGATNLVPFMGRSYAMFPGTRDSFPSAGGYEWQVMAGNVATVAVAAGGSGYVVGDWLVASGGTGQGATFTVATLSGSALATVTLQNPGTGYSAGDTLTLAAGKTVGTGGQLTVSTVGANNVHLTAQGQSIVAHVLYATLSAQSGWLAALQS